MNVPVVIAALAIAAYVSCGVPLVRLWRARRRDSSPVAEPPTHVRIVSRPPDDRSC